jgi:hypothetical protein
VEGEPGITCRIVKIIIGGFWDANCENRRKFLDTGKANDSKKNFLLSFGMPTVKIDENF